MTGLTDDGRECRRCPELASPGGDPTLCPACEDLERGARGHRIGDLREDRPPASPAPPHGNTTR